MVEVKFVNKSAEQIQLYNEDGSILKVLENAKCWNRDPKGGTLRTTIIHETESPPPPQEDPKWIDRVVWETEVADSSPYANFKTITFLDGNKIHLKKRFFWKFMELDFPVTTFLFKSNKLKIFRERLDRDLSVLASIFLNGIPVRKTVAASSKYSEYRNWYFLERLVPKDSPKQMESTEIIEWGEGIRNSTELKKLAKMRWEEREREKIKLV